MARAGEPPQPAMRSGRADQFVFALRHAGQMKPRKTITLQASHASLASHAADIVALIEEEAAGSAGGKRTGRLVSTWQAE